MQTLKNIQTVVEAKPMPVERTDIRSIMQEEKNEQLAEQTEQKQRACNIILHGVEEAQRNDLNEVKQHDEAYVRSLVDTLGQNVAFKSVTRLGNRVDTNKRPIKVTMQSEEEK